MDTNKATPAPQVFLLVETNRVSQCDALNEARHPVVGTQLHCFACRLFFTIGPVL